LTNVSKVYGANGHAVYALRHVSLEIKRGELLVVMGPSGSGKSTLLNIVGTLDRPTEGEVVVAGVRVSELNEDALSRVRCRTVGFVFQFFNLINNLTALENVMLPMVLSGDYTTSEAREKARELLRLVGLEGLEERRPTQLSGGQQQRVAIARALANDPAIVLMDEPTGSVDAEAASKILSLVRWLNRVRGHTFMIVTHNPDVAAIATRVVYIRDGVLYERPPESAMERVKALRDLPGARLAYLRMLLVELRSLLRRLESGAIGPQDGARELERLRRVARELGVRV